jgi:hypothetical protein
MRQLSLCNYDKFIISNTEKGVRFFDIFRAGPEPQQLPIE